MFWAVRSIRWLVAGLVTASCVACTGSGGSTGSAERGTSAAPAPEGTRSVIAPPCPSQGRVKVTPPASMKFGPWSLAVSGLRAGHEVTVGLRTTDNRDNDFTSTTRFVVPANGTIDTATTAPSGGSYARTDRSGPLTSLAAEGVNPELADGAKPLKYTVTVTDGGCVAASGTFTRGGGAEMQATTYTTVAKDGIAAAYVRPARAGAPVVIIIGGGEGGYSGGWSAMALRDRGYGVAWLAYFHEAGLPTDPVHVPVEYFDKVLAWVKKQPGVAGRPLVVLGGSLGSEPAQLLAIRHPQDIAAVVLASGSYRVTPGAAGETESGFSIGGKPLPSSPWPEPGKALDPRDPSRIPLEKYPGPVLTVCGTDDAVWNACGSGQVIAAARRNLPTTQVVAPGASHKIAALVPDIAGFTTQRNNNEGFPGATALGTQKAWTALTQLLDAL